MSIGQSGIAMSGLGDVLVIRWSCKLTIFVPCHRVKLSAYIPARALSFSTLRMAASGTLNLADLRSSEAKARNGGSR